MAGTREAVDAAHLKAVESGEADTEAVRAIPGQQDFEGNVVRQKDGGDIVESFPEEIRVDGTTQLSAFEVGGKRARSASIRLSCGKVLLTDGQAFSKGEVVTFSGTAVIREVGQRDKPDPATGIVVSCEQRHVAEIVDLRIGG
jgi:hypothetical protein